MTNPACRPIEPKPVTPGKPRTSTAHRCLLALFILASAAHAAPVTRPGISYTTWAAGNPQLSDPNADADKDGNSNLLEYGAGTNAIDPASRPAGTLTTEDLTGLGLSNRERIYSVVASTLADDLTLVPSTSANLNQWSFAPLAFLNATDLGGGRSLFRYRLTTPNDPARFFRMGISATPPPP